MIDDGIQPEATVIIKANGKEMHEADTGVGPVDALAKVLKKSLKSIFPTPTLSSCGRGKACLPVGRGEGGNEMEFIMDREKIEKAIKEKSKDGKVPCAMCFKIAEDFGISKREIGDILNEMKVKISQCQLGCFE
ncbi:MAG: hypothetical protein Q8P64_27815 [Deltaproteobacteria bacterium]|nr:hypothetical protein [Deltaproteobacteria bacterium]